MWTYRVTHIEWARNQSLGLKLIFKPKGSLCEFIHSFSRLREAARVFVRLNPVLAHSFLSRFPIRLIRVDSIRGWSNLAAPFSLTRGFDAHMRLRNKDLPTRIRYSSIPKSSDRITWIPSRVSKRAKFFFFFPLCMYA